MHLLASDQLTERIKAIAYLVAAIALLLGGTVIAVRAKKLSADVRGVKLTMETQLVPAVTAVKTTTETNSVAIEQINVAVNHKLPHEPTMVKRLASVEHAVQGIDSKLEKHIASNQLWQNQLVSAIGIDVRQANTEQTNKESTP